LIVAQAQRVREVDPCAPCTRIPQWPRTALGNAGRCDACLAAVVAAAEIPVSKAGW
jgi:4'-phosphopantetheinyl transferase EntD